MHVLAAQVEFHLPASRSLKDKRRIRQSLLTRWWGMRLAAAEVALNDQVDRLVLGCALVGPEPGPLLERMAEVERMCYACAEAEVVQFVKEFR